MQYMSGFGNHFETEALPNTLPQGQNSPQKCNYGLYAEQLSGSAFTMPQHENYRSWLYRIRPSVKHVGEFQPEPQGFMRTAPNYDQHSLPIGAKRWSPTPIPQEPCNFIQGIKTITLAGNSDARSGMATHIYTCNHSMQTDYFFNADGEYLIVPEHNTLRFITELGVLEVCPGEIIVIPRGIVFKVELTQDNARGYICENYGSCLKLPDRGPIGANCLANPRDFQYPVASYEDKEASFRLWVKWGGDLWSCEINQSPLDVVGWHGNYAPYKYNLSHFSPVGSILFDHPDPSIFTVLTSPSSKAGTANIDFVIFPERWLVAEQSFRPPWYHRNIMSEFMGLIYGVYDAKPDGFAPGGFSLHNVMLPHGPDTDSFDNASHMELKPQKLSHTMAFMFESCLPQRVTAYAANLPTLKKNYTDCWQGLKKHFTNSN